MNTQPVPRLDLAPKLDRMLSLRRPTDYISLLYWAIFFPQALRWYIECFGSPKYKATRGALAVLKALRHDPVQRRLVFQAMISSYLAVLAIAWGLQFVGLPIDWSGVVGGVTGGLVFGVGLGVAVSIGLGLMGGGSSRLASGVAAMVALGVTAGVGFGLVGGVVLGVASAAALGVASGVAFGTLVGVLLGLAAGVAFGLAGGVTFGAASDVSFGVTGGLLLAVASMLAFGIAFGIMVGVTVGAMGGIAFALAVVVTVGRLPDWIWAWAATSFSPTLVRGSHMAWLPIPVLRQRLQTWLEADWDAGVYNVNQVLAYTLQFIAAIDAVNAVLARSADEQLLERAATLSKGPFYRNMLYIGTTSPGHPMPIKQQLVHGLLTLPRLFTRRRQIRLAVNVALDTPARAACIGFWAWHEGKVRLAADAFTVVRDLRHGPELHGIAQAIVAGQGAAQLKHLIAWETLTTWLDEPSIPASPNLFTPQALRTHLYDAVDQLHPRRRSTSGGLRPGVLDALRVLRKVALDARVAHESQAPLNRSAALGRANAALTRLLEEGKATCPHPEWPLIRIIAARWRDIVSLAGGVVGQEVLRQPTPNPYEGYSGLPVTGHTFVGRSDILRQIETRWASGDLLPPLIVYGHRRMGKSSILLNLAHRAAPGTLLVYLDMQDVGWVDHTGELLLDLAESLHCAALESRLEAGPTPAESDFGSLGSARRALNALLDRLDPQMSVGRRLILAVDEFELIEEGIKDGRIDAGLLPYLRAVNQRYHWLALIFAGLHTLDEMGRDYRSAFYGQAEHLRVGYLGHKSALRLITQPHPDFALEYQPELRERLYHLTSGQPYLLQRLCWELVNIWNERFLQSGEDTPRILTMSDLAQVLTVDFYHSAGYYFDGVWSNITEAEQAVMILLSQRTDPPRTFDELAAASGQTLEAFQAVLTLLRRHDVVVEQAGSVRFASELMRHWVAEYRLE